MNPTVLSSTILITGADGFIGSHLTEALVRQAYKVRTFVLYNFFGAWGWLDHCASDFKGQFEVFAGDIRDPHGVKEAMKGCDACCLWPLLSPFPTPTIRLTPLSPRNQIRSGGCLAQDLHDLTAGLLGGPQC